MTSPSPDAKPRAPRPSRTSRDPMIRVVTALPDRDEAVIAFLRYEGFQVDIATLESLERTAVQGSAEAIIVDADLEGALGAVARIRKHEGVVSTIPIVLVGAPGASLRTSLDAVDAGGDAFVPRPVSGEDLTSRLKALLELPGVRPTSVIPPQRPLPSPEEPLRAPTAPLHSAAAATTASGLSPALADVLRSAAVRAGGNESELVLPSLDDEAIDELIPAELLEPLDAPLDTLGDEALSAGPQQTPPPYSPSGPRRTSNRGMTAVGQRGQHTPTITPLAVGGEMRLAGSVGRHGAGAVLGAAWRSRAPRASS